MYMHELRCLNMSFVVNTPVKLIKECSLACHKRGASEKNLEFPELFELVGVNVKKVT